jgi:glycosyltransferase involved in cell wall biosynthesis
MDRKAADRKLHIVHTEASLGWGGQEIRILTEAAGMRARGHQVTLLAPAESRIYREAQERQIPATALAIGRKNLTGLLALSRWLRSHTVDIINTHSSTDTWLVALALRLSRRRVPLIRTRHISAPVPNNFTTHWLYQRATTHIATTGERLRETLIHDNGYRPETISSVPTGIDTTRFQPGDRAAARRALELPEARPIIGIVATLRSWKGHRYLLRAFSELKDRNAILAIVGDGPQREALERQIVELGLGDRVIMAGNQSDVVPWLHAMDIFVLPSYANEGVPQALLQAMLCALPVVTTTIGSITEAVSDGKTGLVIAPENVGQLRAAIERLLGDPVLRQTLGAAARTHAETQFGLDGMLDKMEAIFIAAANHG